MSEAVLAVYLHKPEHERNWGAVANKLGLAALEGLTLNIPNVLREIDGAVAGTGVEHTVDERAWVWLRTTLCTGLLITLRDLSARISRMTVASNLLRGMIIYSHQ